jgi:hypothetical protein
LVDKPCPCEYLVGEPCPCEYLVGEPCPCEYLVGEPCPCEYLVGEPCPCEYLADDFRVSNCSYWIGAPSGPQGLRLTEFLRPPFLPLPGAMPSFGRSEDMLSESSLIV